MKAFRKNNVKLSSSVCNDTMDSGAERMNLNGARCAVLFGRSKCVAENDETTQAWRVAA